MEARWLLASPATATPLLASWRRPHSDIVSGLKVGVVLDWLVLVAGAAALDDDDDGIGFGWECEVVAVVEGRGEVELDTCGYVGFSVRFVAGASAGRQGEVADGAFVFFSEAGLRWGEKEEGRVGEENGREGELGGGSRGDGGGVGGADES